MLILERWSCSPSCASASIPPPGWYATRDPRAGRSGGLAWLNFAGKPLQSALLDQLVSSHVRDCCVRNRLRRRPHAPERYDSGGGGLGSTLGLSGLLIGSYAAK